MENGKYVVSLYKYDAVEQGDLFVILHIYNKFLSYKKSNRANSCRTRICWPFGLFKQPSQAA